MILTATVESKPMTKLDQLEASARLDCTVCRRPDSYPGGTCPECKGTGKPKEVIVKAKDLVDLVELVHMLELKLGFLESGEAMPRQFKVRLASLLKWAKT